MNKTREVLNEKGVIQTELAKRLGKGSIWPIYMSIKFSRPYPYYTELRKTDVDVRTFLNDVKDKI